MQNLKHFLQNTYYILRRCCSTVCCRDGTNTSSEICRFVHLNKYIKIHIAHIRHSKLMVKRSLTEPAATIELCNTYSNCLL